MRKNDINLMVPAERAIFSAQSLIEELGAHDLLTDAVILLSKAKDKVSEFVDMKK